MIRSLSIQTIPRTADTGKKQKLSQKEQQHEEISVGELYKKFLIYFGLQTSTDNRGLPPISTETSLECSADAGSYKNLSLGQSRSLDLDRQLLLPKHKNSLSLNKKGYHDTDRGLARKDEHQREDSVLHCAKPHQNYFKPTGMRNNYLTGYAINTGNQLSFKNNPTLNVRTTFNNTPPSPKDPDDLVAMGTNWNPPPTYQKGSGHFCSLPNTNANLGYVIPAVSGTMVTSFGSTGYHRMGSKASIGSLGGPGRAMRENEPRYAEPLIGAPHSLQQRVIEISSLESETVRWEKSRKVKKKLSKDS